MKAASQVAAGIAPSIEEMATPKRRKRDAITGAFRRAKTLVGLGKELREVSAELVADSCDVDEPEVCEDEGKFKAATREMRGLIAKTLRFARGSATEEELATEMGDDMEAGWQSRGQGSACALSNGKRTKRRMRRRHTLLSAVYTPARRRVHCI